MAFTEREERIVGPLYSLLDLLGQKVDPRDHEDAWYYRQQVQGAKEELEKILSAMEDEDEEKE